MPDIYNPAETDRYMLERLGQTPEQRTAAIDAAIERNITRWAGREDWRPETPTSPANASDPETTQEPTEAARTHPAKKAKVRP